MPEIGPEICGSVRPVHGSRPRKRRGRPKYWPLPTIALNRRP